MNGENAAAGSAELMGSKRDGSENPHVGTDEVSRDVDPKDLGFLFDIVRVPCFRDSLLFGIPAGLVLGALRFYRLSDATRATDLAIKGIAAFSMTSWIVCRYEYRERRRKIRTAFEEQQRLILTRIMLEKEEEDAKKGASG
eukprot:CAMPEP_0185829118 /NCGR_PEP_ID=MMETSP1353-20130828/55_1 /TAXON_ID=1077150 /ORGANISM="Erythrolobus australicus, Strain CCMP3124" /LENGTH=140 /DNA_ID=CAMNT_0028526869 /DNA_START=34 /DNA_END=456 /DNA_ORIENTATION=-